MTAWLEPVREALDSAAEPVAFFFRDDDAGWRDDRLDALLDLFEQHAVPIDVAVIPSALSAQLARRLHARGMRAPGLLGIHQHGFAHENHEPPPSRPCEFGPARARADQLRDLAAGRRRLLGLLGPLVAPVFTPPWNRCTAVTGECLVELGFTTLSRDATAPALGRADLAELPVRVDWLARRRGARVARDEVVRRVEAAIREGGPVGIMLHHAVMDAAERASVAELLGVLSASRRAVFCSLSASAPAPASTSPPVAASSALADADRR